MVTQFRTPPAMGRSSAPAPPLPFGDVADRLSIHILYSRLAPESYDAQSHAIYSAHFDAEISLSESRKREYLKKLLTLNRRMWPVEAKLRSAPQENLAEVGRAALTLRRLNRLRQQIKSNADREA